LLGERLVLAERGRGDVVALTERQKNPGRFVDRDSGACRSGRFRGGLRLAVPGTRFFPCARYGLRFVPIGFAGLPAPELTGQGTRNMNQAGAPFPTTAALFKLSGARVLGMAAFAFLAVPAIELERHKSRAPILARLHAIARWKEGIPVSH